MRLALYLSGAAVLALLAWTVLHSIYAAGYSAALAEQARIVKGKTDAANKADDAMRRCLIDPSCRMQDDGYKRRD